MDKASDEANREGYERQGKNPGGSLCLLAHVADDQISMFSKVLRCQHV
jgi:hypothetical protein